MSTMRRRSKSRGALAGLLVAFWMIGACDGPTTPADGGGGDGAACSPACGTARQCCAGGCVNNANDPRNCGGCGVSCTGDTYCTGGRCEPRPCTTTCPMGTTCCAGACCAAGQLCCDPQGPIDRGPVCTAPDDRGTCPMGCAPLCICASPDTPIATPSGERPIAGLRIGDLVYSADHAGVIVVPILQTNRTPVRQHQVVRVTLASGAVLEISAGHPTADGRTFGDLRVADTLDQVAIRALERVPYGHPYTYDILPDSASGAYFAGGVLIGSTLKGTGALSTSAQCER